MWSGFNQPLESCSQLCMEATNFILCTPKLEMLELNTLAGKTEFKWKICGYLKPTVGKTTMGKGLLCLNKSSARMVVTIQSSSNQDILWKNHTCSHSFIYLLTLLTSDFWQFCIPFEHETPVIPMKAKIIFAQVLNIHHTAYIVRKFSLLYLFHWKHYLLVVSA